MQVLLRHVRTEYYYKGNSEWVTAQTDAKHFRTIEQALGVIIHERLDGMSLIIRYDESGTEQVLDLSQELKTQLPKSVTDH